MLNKLFDKLSNLRPAVAGTLAGASVLVTISIAGSSLYFSALQAVRAEVREDIERIATVAAATVNGDLHGTFDNPKQESTPEYAKAIKPLADIQAASDQIAFIYTMILDKGKIRFVLDPTESGDTNGDGLDEKSHIYQEYDDATPAALEALTAMRTVSEDQPYTDEWGTFISGYAPVRDSKGQCVAIVGVDLKADDFMNRMQGVRNAGIGGLLLGTVLSFGLSVMAYFAQKSAHQSRDNLIESQSALASAMESMALQNGELNDQRMQLEHANQLSKVANEQLRTASLRFEQLFHGLPIACFTFDCNGFIREFNPEFERLLQIDLQSIMERPMEELLPDLSKAAGDIFEGRELHGFEWEYMRADGNSVCLSTNAFAIKLDGKAVGGIGAIIDVTETKDLQAEIAEKLALSQDLNAKLETLSVTDGLTGVKNRRAFQDAIQDHHALANRYRKPLSLVLLDVDMFKSYNDTFGHQAGDEVLKEVARVLQHEARLSDVVARYGGEEFVIILPETGADEAIQVAERMRAALEANTWRERPVTASFGVSTFLNGNLSVEAMVKSADEALYVAKENGRNRVVHTNKVSKKDTSAA